MTVKSPNAEGVKLPVGPVAGGKTALKQLFHESPCVTGNLIYSLRISHMNMIHPQSSFQLLLCTPSRLSATSCPVLVSKHIPYWVQLVLPVCTRVKCWLLEHGRPTKGRVHEENWRTFPAVPDPGVGFVRPSPTLSMLESTGFPSTALGKVTTTVGSA